MEPDQDQSINHTTRTGLILIHFEHLDSASVNPCLIITLDLLILTLICSLPQTQANPSCPTEVISSHHSLS